MKPTVKVFVDLENGDVTIATTEAARDAVDIEVIEVSRADDSTSQDHGFISGRTDLLGCKVDPNWATDRHSFS